MGGGGWSSDETRRCASLKGHLYLTGWSAIELLAQSVVSTHGTKWSRRAWQGWNGVVLAMNKARTDGERGSAAASTGLPATEVKSTEFGGDLHAAS